MVPGGTELRELLAGVPIFGSFTAEQLDRIADIASVVEYPSEHVIAERDGLGDSLFVVVEGTLQVIHPSRSAQVDLARMGPGDVYGEMAVLNPLPGSATVRTASEARVLKLESIDFRKLLKSSPEMAIVLLEGLSLRLRNADEQISELGDQALRDPLTGLFNRRAFHDRLAEEANRTRRYGDPFSLVLLDLDGFRAISEDFGPTTADRILSWVGRLITEHTRAADSAYRLGGEEFAVICPSSEGEFAANAAKRLVDVIGQNRPPLEVGLQVTISAGYASAPADGRHPDALFHAADRALLRTKAEGRSRVSPPGGQL